MPGLVRPDSPIPSTSARVNNANIRLVAAITNAEAEATARSDRPERVRLVRAPGSRATAEMPKPTMAPPASSETRRRTGSPSTTSLPASGQSVADGLPPDAGRNRRDHQCREGGEGPQRPGQERGPPSRCRASIAGIRDGPGGHRDRRMTQVPAAAPIEHDDADAQDPGQQPSIRIPLRRDRTRRDRRRARRGGACGLDRRGARRHRGRSLLHLPHGLLHRERDRPVDGMAVGRDDAVGRPELPGRAGRSARPPTQCRPRPQPAPPRGGCRPQHRSG